MPETNSLMLTPETSDQTFNRQLNTFIATPFAPKDNIQPSLPVGNESFYKIAIETLGIDIEQPSHRHQMKGAITHPDTTITREYFPTNKPNTYLELVTDEKEGLLTRQLIKTNLNDSFKIPSSS